MSHYIAIDPTNCTGCKTCEMVCSLYHWGEINPWKSAIRVIRKETRGLVYALPLVCQQCIEPTCIEVYVPGAISRANLDADIIFNRELCIDCGLCADACPAGCVPIDLEGHVIMYCDFCGGKPQCVMNCHWQCLSEISTSSSESISNTNTLVDIIKKEDLNGYLPLRRLK